MPALLTRTSIDPKRATAVAAIAAATAGSAMSPSTRASSGPATRAVDFEIFRDGIPDAPLPAGPFAEVDWSVKSPIADDRDQIRKGDRVLLVIEDDVKFARIMVGMAREKGFKAVVATRGDTGLALANELQPSAITLDIQLVRQD